MDRLSSAKCLVNCNVVHSKIKGEKENELPMELREYDMAYAFCKTCVIDGNRPKVCRDLKLFCSVLTANEVEGNLPSYIFFNLSYM